MQQNDSLADGYSPSMDSKTAALPDSNLKTCCDMDGPGMCGSVCPHTPTTFVSSPIHMPGTVMSEPWQPRGLCYLGRASDQTALCRHNAMELSSTETPRTSCGNVCACVCMCVCV